MASGSVTFVRKCTLTTRPVGIAKRANGTNVKNVARGSLKRRKMMTRLVAIHTNCSSVHKNKRILNLIIGTVMYVL
jgi:hypothetical protein